MNENQFVLTGPDGSVIATGSMAAAAEVAAVLTARADLEEILRQKQQLDAAVARIINGITTLTADMFGRLEAEHRAEATRQAEEEWQRAEAEEAAEQRRIEEMLDSLPSPDDPHAFHPSGDLHSLPAKDSEPEDPDEIIPDPDDPSGTVLEDAGPVPLSYGRKGPPLSYVRREGKDEGSPVPGQPIPPSDKPTPEEIARLTQPEELRTPRNPAGVSLW